MRRIAPTLLIALLGALAAPSAGAHPGEVARFPLPAGRGPHGITTGPDGAIWFANRYANTIGRITTAGALREFPVPTPDSRPFEITAGPDGNLWFTESAAQRIGRITPDGVVSEYHLPEWDCGAVCRPWGITAGPDGNLWFTASGMFGAIGRISPAGEITMFRSGGEARGIAVGPDGNLWVAEVTYEREEPVSGKIARVTTDGSVTGFLLPTADREFFPTYIAAGPDGNLWFVGNGVGRIDPSGRMKFLDVPVPGFPIGGELDGIVTGPDGNLWLGSDSPGTLLRVTAHGRTSHFRVGPSVGGVAVGPDGNIWFTVNSDPSAIGRLTPGLAGIEIGTSSASVRGGFTRLPLACSGGGRRSRCKGVLKLVGCAGGIEPGPCRGATVVAQAGYDLRSGRSGHLRLRLTGRGMALLDRFRVLMVKATARASLGAGMSVTVTLRRRSRRGPRAAASGG
jgi:streptogramin lyase